MKPIVLAALVVLNLMISAAAAETCNGGLWSLRHQQPSSCTPYLQKGIFPHQLPNAGNGGPLSNLAPNSDAIAENTLTNGGTIAKSDRGYGYVATPGSDDWLGVQMYYGTSSDPIYKVSSCSINCGILGSPGYALNTYFHIPNQARGGRTGDSFFRVWDQTQNKILGIYAGQFTFPPCTATTTETACPTGDVFRAQVTDYTADTDYGYKNGAGDSLFNASFAGVVRAQEWMDGTINHALLLNTMCTSDTTPVVFPAPAWAGAGGCKNDNYIHAVNPTLRPSVGSLFFLDYTDAQINAMTLPAFQRTLLLAMTHYGAYITDTGDTNGVSSLTIARFEGGEAYLLDGGSPNPLYAWLAGQGVSCTGPGGNPNASTCRYLLPMLNANIPNLVGPNCPTGTCGVEKHIHIADPCVAKGFAGVSGGCASTAPPVIKPPNNLRITTVNP